MDFKLGLKSKKVGRQERNYSPSYGVSSHSEKKSSSSNRMNSHRGESKIEAIRFPYRDEDSVDSSPFKREIEHVHHKFSRRNGRRHRSDLYDDNDHQELFNDSFSSGEIDRRNSSKHMSAKKGTDYRKELGRTQRMLECEKAQKCALQERLQDLEKQVFQLMDSRTRSRSKGGDFRQLQETMDVCQTQLEEERRKNKLMRQELEKARKENRDHMEKVQLLMFQHIPSSSSNFKDIGAVNSKIKESAEAVGNYHLGNVLGEGHYGSVQIGTNISTKGVYAVKILNKERISRYKDLVQVALEVHVLKNYTHPNIIRVQDVIHATKNIYLVTELCLMDLHKFHNEVGLKKDTAKEIIYGILRPLQFLHSKGICHLDLKPENVLLSRTANLKSVTFHDVRLCDFGLVNMAKDPSVNKDVIRKGYACGTPGFFAPEMVVNNEFEGRLADMWSLGCIILEITLGFTQEWIDSYNLTETDPKAFQKGIQECLDEIAPESYPNHPLLLDLIHGCLSIDPTKRMDSRTALSHRWFQGVAVPEEGREEACTSGRGLYNQIQRLANGRNMEGMVAPKIICS